MIDPREKQPHFSLEDQQIILEQFPSFQSLLKEQVLAQKKFVAQKEEFPLEDEKAYGSYSELFRLQEKGGKVKGIAKPAGYEPWMKELGFAITQDMDVDEMFAPNLDPEETSIRKMSKDGGELIYLIGTSENPTRGVIINVIKDILAASVWETLAESDIPVAPILRQKRGKAKLRSYFNSESQNTRVSSRYCGLPFYFIVSKLKILTETDQISYQLRHNAIQLEKEITNQLEKTSSSLASRGVLHRHLHLGNVTVEFVKRDYYQKMITSGQNVNELQVFDQGEQVIQFNPALYLTNPEDWVPVVRAIDWDAVQVVFPGGWDLVEKKVLEKTEKIFASGNNENKKKLMITLLDILGQDFDRSYKMFQKGKESDVKFPVKLGEYLSTHLANKPQDDNFETLEKALNLLKNSYNYLISTDPAEQDKAYPQFLEFLELFWSLTED